MSRRQILEESENPHEPPFYIKLPYPYPKKRMSEGYTALTENYNAIFLGQLR